MSWRGPRLGIALATVTAIGVISVASPLGRAIARGLVLLANGDVNGLRTYVLGAGVWAPAVMAGLMVLQAVIAPLPSSPVSYVNGLLFGVWWGGVLSWASALLAAAVCFALSRHFGRPAAERLITRSAVEWSDRFFRRFGAYAVLIGRLVPIVSFDVVSYGAGLTRMSFNSFIIATAVGMIPGTLLYVYLGRLGRQSGGALMWTLTALTALGVIVALAARIFSKRLLKTPADSDLTLRRCEPHERGGERC